ncbi:hypothetical protein V6L77_10735 [Pannonibacter sp. Pt2-lr]
MSNSPSVSLPALAPDRVHEASGPAALAFALLQAAQPREGKGTDKAVLLIVPTHLRGGLLPSGVAPLIDPSRLITVFAPTQTDQLWSMEEALRSGAVHAVITLTEKPLTLTQAAACSWPQKAGARWACSSPDRRAAATPAKPAGSACPCGTRWTRLCKPGHL